ncbi:MAG: carbamoyltransferase family protein [Gammaproteobacteria bacterium]
MRRYFIGLATTFHDPALAIVGPDGEVLFAEAAERFLQNKRAINCEPDHIFRIADLLREYCPAYEELVVACSWSRRSARLPWWAALLGLAGRLGPGLLAAGLPMEGLAKLLLYRRYALYHLALCSQSSHMKAGANLMLALRRELGGRRVRFLQLDHHLTHAAVACHMSPFTDAACLVADGIGERGSLAYYTYRNGRLSPLHRPNGPESLGALFMLVTDLCGFSALKGEEWKVMGLAAYGRHAPAIEARLRALYTLEYPRLRYAGGADLRRAVAALEAFRRPPGTSPRAAADLAHTWQRLFGEAMDRLLRQFQAETGKDALVLTGGCALNSSYAGTIVGNTGFKRVFIPCAPADDGNAVGAALLAYQAHGGRWPARTAGPGTPYLGSSVAGADLGARLQRARIPKLRHCPETICEETAHLLAQGRIIGWVQGRAELGPRALGNRSILADPRSPIMPGRINAEVKFREEFRPFAPAILHEYGPVYFEDYQDSPYMERTLRFRPEVLAKVPGVVHVDGTGRLQTVKREWNARFYELLRAFHALTGIPLLLNTSFNVMGRPMIHGLEDALGCFYSTGMDALVLEDYLIEK